LSLSANSSEYVNLPAGILNGYTNVTIDLWASFPATLPWNCWLFGFGNMSGNDGVNYMHFMPQSTYSAITDSNWSGEQGASANIDQSNQNNVHITTVVNTSDDYMKLYVNGTLVGLNSAVSLPMGSVSNVFSYIGRSLYANDPYCDVNLDEFRIYNGALTVYEVQAAQSLGPGQLLETNSTPIGIEMSASNVLLKWPAAYASAMMLQSRTNLVEGIWEDQPMLEPALIDGEWQFSLPLSETNEFFRLKH